MKLLTIIFLLITALSPLSTQTDQKEKPQVGKEFTIKYGQQIVLKEGLTVDFISIVEDSRCPQGAKCIDAGEAKISVKISKNGADPKTLELSTDRNPEKTTYQQYFLELINVQPHPKVHGNSDKNSFEATIIVKKIITKIG